MSPYDCNTCAEYFLCVTEQRRCDALVCFERDMCPRLVSYLGTKKSGCDLRGKLYWHGRLEGCCDECMLHQRVCKVNPGLYPEPVGYPMKETLTREGGPQEWIDA